MFVLAYIEQIFDSITSKFPTPHQITHILKIFPPDIAYIGTEKKIQRAKICREAHVKAVCINEKRDESARLQLLVLSMGHWRSRLVSFAVVFLSTYSISFLAKYRLFIIVDWHVNRQGALNCLVN
jgi:hypothetical protein